MHARTSHEHLAARFTGARKYGHSTRKAIATFENGKYPNQAHGNHAAIYISQDAKGIQVYDQWAANKLGVHARTIKWGGEDPSNDGNAFSVIE